MAPKPKLDLSLKLPPRPDEPETAEYYKRRLAEEGPEFEGYESTSYAASTLAGHVDDVGLYDPYSPPPAATAQRAGTDKLASNVPLPGGIPPRRDGNQDPRAGGPFSDGMNAYADAESIGAYSGDGAWAQGGGGWGTMVRGGGSIMSEASAAKPVIRGAFFMAERRRDGDETPGRDPYASGNALSQHIDDATGALPTPLRDDREGRGGGGDANKRRGRGRRAPRPRDEDIDDTVSLGSMTPRSGVEEVAAFVKAQNDVEEDDPAEVARKKSKNGAMTEHEISVFYATAERRALVTTGLPPSRLRHPKALWNGDRPALCRLTRAGKPESSGAWECFLSRNYTEGFKKPTAFASAPPADVLCNSCGDVAWDPVRDVAGKRSSVWCRACLCAVRGERAGETAPEHGECVSVVDSLKVVCRNALVPTRSQGRGDGSILWRMDKAGCPDVCRLGDRRTIETNCAYAVEECCLPRGSANPGDCCRRRVRRRDMAEHRSGCDHRLVKCDHSGCDRMTQARYAASHARLCENRPFACPNRPRCEWMGTRAGVEDHLTECLHEVIPCGFVDGFKDECAGTCAVTLPRVQMMAHKEVCRYQSAECKHCGESMALRRLGQHEATCSARFYECQNCAQRVHKQRRRQHDETVCPGVRVECMYRRYGCDAKVLKCDYARHLVESFDDHAVMVLRNDANAWTEPKDAKTHETLEPSEPLEPLEPLEPSVRSNPIGKQDGFEVMVTRHELTRADLRRVDAASESLSAGLDATLASLTEEIARVEDEVYVDATARLALDMRRTREHMRTLVKETDDEVRVFESKLMDETLELYNDSVAMRRKAEKELAVKTHLDDFVTGYEGSLREVRAELGDLARDVGESTLRLSTAISPALELKDTIERTLVAGLEGLDARIANLEWRGADRAAIAWEKTQDARENFRARCKPRLRQQMRLEEKMELLEGSKFVTPDEDAGLRAKTYNLENTPPDVSPARIAAAEEGDDAAGSEGEPTVPPAPGTPPETSDGLSLGGV